MFTRDKLAYQPLALPARPVLDDAAMAAAATPATRPWRRVTRCAISPTVRCHGRLLRPASEPPPGAQRRQSPTLAFQPDRRPGDEGGNSRRRRGRGA